jgi:hypothetical protein
MKTTIYRANKSATPPMSLEAFADAYGFDMEVHERPMESAGSDSRFYAQFKDVWVKDRSCIVGAYGNGTTVEQAIRNYATRISNTVLVLRHNDGRNRDGGNYEIQAPRLY